MKEILSTYGPIVAALLLLYIGGVAIAMRRGVRREKAKMERANAAFDAPADRMAPDEADDPSAFDGTELSQAIDGSGASEVLLRLAIQRGESLSGHARLAVEPADKETDLSTNNP